MSNHDTFLASLGWSIGDKAEARGENVIIVGHNPKFGSIIVERFERKSGTLYDGYTPNLVRKRKDADKKRLVTGGVWLTVPSGSLVTVINPNVTGYNGVKGLSYIQADDGTKLYVPSSMLEEV
jgi:hypothetical protein